MHLLEAFTWVIKAQQLYPEHGGSTIERLLDLGLLGPALSLAHGVWLSAAEAELVAQQRPWIVHNPMSNLYLADGIAPVARYLRMGVQLGLGTDSCTTAGNLSIPLQLHLAAVLQSLDAPLGEGWLDEQDVLRMATRGSAGAMGLGDELGAVEAGRKADLILLDLNAFPFVPLNDPLNQLVFGGATARVDTVLIDGRVVLRDGRMTLLDEAAIFAEANEIAREQHTAVADAQASVAHLKGPVEAIFRRALSDLDHSSPGPPKMRVNRQW
jgi:guanine deaminase